MEASKDYEIPPGGCSLWIKEPLIYLTRMSNPGILVQSMVTLSLSNFLELSSFLYV